MTTIVENLDAARAKPLLAELRAALDADIFNQRIFAAFDSGYCVMGAEQDGEIVGVLGYRIVLDICWGKTFYVDDLNIAPAQRGTGIGGVLLEAAKSAAHAMGCDHLRLCSGLTRADAHRFYEAHDMKGFSKQFVLKIEGN